MDLSRPTAAVVPSLDGPVLTVLGGTTRPLTGREVGRLVGVRSHGGVQAVLNRMVAAGLVDAIEAAPARLYSLNRDHVATDAVLALLDLRMRLFDRIRGELANWTIPAVAAAVFGSAARGDGDSASDIDVFLVRPDGVDSDDQVWSDAVDTLGRRIRRWSGNSASIIQATPEQVLAMIDRQEPIVSDLRNDAVPLTEQRVLEVHQAGHR